MRALPGSVWALGFVSLFMDVSSELIHSLLPVFMTTVLGASMTTVGFIEGVAEATAAITKVFSGALSDLLRKRKLITVFGYGIAAATKPIFPLASTLGWVFAARFVDRIGKGIRGAPRDALVADIVPPRLRGAAYGLRQALDSVGAFLGPVLALLFMVWLDNDIRTVLWLAVIPALISVAFLIFGVHEPPREPIDAEGRERLSFVGGLRLPLRYWLILLLGALCTLARFSEAFLILRAQDVGLAAGFVPLVLVSMNLAYMISAYPAGAAADIMRSRTLLILGLAVLVGADLILAAATSPAAVLLGAACWGLHMGLTQGLFAKLVADSAPPARRGAAFGIYNLVVGAALLVASVVAGALWNRFGAPATFWTGALFALAAILGLLAHRIWLPRFAH